MSTQRDDKPKIEPAKTGRASCRFCRQKIIKDSFRIGIPYQFTRPDGKTITSYGYYHPGCIPREKIESILDVLDSTPTIDSEEKLELIESLKKRQKEVDEAPQPQREVSRKAFIELSKSSRGTCKICEKKIDKGILRVAEPTQVELEDGRKFSSNKFHHVKCFLESSSDAKNDLKDLLQTSLGRKSISQEEAEELQKNFQKYLLAGETAADVLSIITEEPIEIKVLKRIAKEKGVPFDSVKLALKTGLLKGVYFEPTPGQIQKL